MTKKTTTRLNHRCKTTRGFQVNTPMAMGQVWELRNDTWVVDAVFPRRIRLGCVNLMLTMDQDKLAKFGRLKVL